MVYYYTSKNVKLIRSLMLDYRTLNDLTPHEYMKTYFESSQNIDDSKVSWIIESFLGIHKHIRFFKEICTQIAGELSGEDKDYFAIIFNAIVFQISPKDMSAIYKCMFNLSKVLLDTFAKSLSNIEVLPLIFQIAETEYDKAFVIENIKSPLLSWQPYISKMSDMYKEYLNKIETSKLKKPTVPIDLNVLRRTGKQKINDTIQNPVLDTPPDFLQNKTAKMLTHYKINRNLNRKHEKNKIKALNLYHTVKNNKYHHSQEKPAKRNTDLNDGDIKIKHKRVITSMKNLNNASAEVKTTAATMKRLNERIKECQQGEVKWLQDIVDGSTDMSKIEEILNYDRQERERERLFDIERKHLMGQISYEEAVIAKKKLHFENKRKYEEFLKERKLWEKEIEEWKIKIIENNRKKVEKLSLIELEVINAKNNMTLKKKEMAENLRQDIKESKIIALKNEQAELERRVNMIKEIKILAMISKKSKIPKIIDLTESSGLGLLCEMSIAELQERLVAMKIGLEEDLDKKRNKIKALNLERKQELEETKKSINDYMAEKAESRRGTKSKIEIDISPTNEIYQLKNILLERRNQRMMLTK